MRDAVTEVTSSGRDVPMAHMVRPVSASLMPAARAISWALSTTRSPPKTMPARPPRIDSTHTRGLKSLGGSSSVLFFRAMIMV